MGSATILSNLDEAQSGLTGRLLSSVDEYSSQAFHDTQRPGTKRGLPGFSATTPGKVFWTRHRDHFRWTCRHQAATDGRNHRCIQASAPV